MFVTEKPALAEALAVVRDVVKSKNKFPILDNVLIERDGEQLTALSSNLTLEIRTRFAATIGEEFIPFTCPAHIFADIVRNAPEDRIAVNAIEQAGVMAQIQIKSGRSRLKLPVLPASDFPKLDAGNLSHELSLNASTLQKALRAVEYAAETNQAKFYLCGVRFEPGEDGVSLVTTNGVRLEKRLIPATMFDQDDFANMQAVTIPSESVDKIIKLLEGADEAIVQWSRDRMRVTAGETTLTTKLIDGEYPAWRRIEPAPDSLISRFSGKALSDAIQRLLTVTPDAGNGVAFSFKEDILALRSRDINVGEGEDEIPVETNGEIQTGFHGRHLREAIAHYDGDNFEMLIGVGAAPTLLRISGKESGYTILMPMQVKGAFSHG
ncbi:DNA polymerase III subunit beta [Rhizobium sp. WW22]|uniref:DNA polymerase III subunit beta n=1 Tax=Rhizobium sp. WW22 TaxID=3389070 RepID=UPI00399BCD88